MRRAERRNKKHKVRETAVVRQANVEFKCKLARKRTFREEKTREEKIIRGRKCGEACGEDMNV